ncbi:DUF3857 domain-containing protein [Vogesella sp. DC21W]|uniref:DUF3857 domain-containing protein n=1 Tax=Vogesella aquatica TaxID=2984206 RepID=A0ABT5IZC6_9NEIS|nr:DUF3857 domain-containing protein [Vogesella aquatica]MDC7717926.1 DUF3857 domain-containing protein [Vogesella aquatica]
MNAPYLFPLALLLSLPAMAEVNLVYHVDLQLQAGRSTQEMTRDILLEDDSDVARNRVRQLEYRPETQTVTLLEAYTVLPDGRRVPVPASAVTDQPYSKAQANPYTQSMRSLDIAFPQAAKGARVVYRFRTDSQLLPLQARQGDFYPASVKNLRSVHFSLGAPASSGLKVAANADIREQAPADGRVQWQAQWQAQWQLNGDGAQPVPHFAYSAYRDWSALGQAYAHLWPLPQPSAAIQDKAAQLVATSDGERLKEMQALYRWVAELPAPYLAYSSHALQPRAAEQVLVQGYGNSRDKVALLQALLAARGLDSYPQLARRHRSALPLLPTSLAFDDVLLHVPAQGSMRAQWLDPAGRASAGAGSMLPVVPDVTPLPFGAGFSPALLGSPQLPLRAPYDPRPF